MRFFSDKPKTLRNRWRKLLPLKTQRIIVGVYLFVAVMAPFLSGHDPLAVRSAGRWRFPACSAGAYFELPDGSRQLKASIDWRTRNEDFLLLPPIPYAPEETDPLNNRCISPFGNQRMAAINGETVELPLRYRHWLGTTFSGKDVLALLIHGCRTSLIIGLLTMLLSGLIGFVFGGIAGWAGNHRWRVAGIRLPVDHLHTAATSALSGLPRFMLVLVLSVSFTRSISTVVFVLGITGWVELSRSVRTGLLQLRSTPFMEQAISAGTSDRRILFRHAWPNLSALSTNLLLTIAASAIVAESALTFLGAGLPADLPSWGQLLTESRRFPEAWWLSLFPVLAIFGLTFALFRTAEISNSR